MVVGEAPSPFSRDYKEAFSGKTKEILDSLLKELQISRNEMYITTASKCPTVDSIEKKNLKICAEKYLCKEIKMVKPKFILILGASALYAVLKKTGIQKRQGEIIEQDGITYFISLHPSVLLRKSHLYPHMQADFVRFRKHMQGERPGGELNFSNVTTFQELDKALTYLESLQSVCYDLETTGLNPRKDSILCIALGDHQKQFLIWNTEGEFKDRSKELQSKLTSFFKRCTNLVAHNGRFDNQFLKQQFGISLNQTIDTMLAYYLLQEKPPHGLKPVCKMLFNAPDWDKGIAKPFDLQKNSFTEVAIYTAYDIYYTSLLFQHTIQKLEQQPRLYRFYEKLMLPASKLMEVMETEGVTIHKAKHQALAITYSDEIGALERRMREIFSEPEINFNSPAQVAVLLFEKLQLPIKGLTPKGKYSVSESVLKQVLTETQHPGLSLLMEYREKTKLLQFLKNWEEHFEEEDGDLVKIHPNFLLHGTVTGRLSCRNPNLQQVPRDINIRSLITAPKGYVLIEADYSQIELRIIAHLANELKMIQAYNRGEDIHTITASTILNIPLDKVEKADRKKAKAVNFGFMYGMGAKKFQEYARDKFETIFTLEESLAFRRKFFQLYPYILQWHEHQRILVRSLQYVENLLGRKRNLPEILSYDEGLIHEAERQAVNSPVQSFASDLTLLALTRLQKAYPHDIKPVGLVHDAILFCVPENNIDSGIKLVKEFMLCEDYLEHGWGVELKVPLDIEIKVGDWGVGKIHE